MPMRVAVLALVLPLAAVCAGPAEPRCVHSCETVSPPPLSTSEAALAYLNSALDVMQGASINKYQIDWSTLRAAAIEKAAGAQTSGATYPAIVYALGQLGDHHSTFVYPSGQQSVPLGSIPLEGAQMRAYIVSSDIAWVLLPNTYATSNLVSWQDQAQRLVSDLDRSKPCGWIVDLRRNPGGNMWPMLVAIGPVLGEGDVGSFITADSARTGWFYAAGEAGTTSGDVRSVRSKVENAHQLNHPGAPVAVLIGPSTASAGEAIAVAFHGRPLTIFIGEATAGVPTANTLIALGDGAKLNLTVAADADRDGVVFWPGSVRPDLAASATVVDPTNTSDEAAQTAVRWLHRQAACQPDSVSAP